MTELHFQGKTISVPEPKSSSEVLADLEAKIGSKRDSETNYCFIEVDINHFKAWFDVYGPEQRILMLYRLYAELKREEISKSNDIEYTARIGDDKFLCVSTSANPEALVGMIKSRLESVTVEKYDEAKSRKTAGDFELDPQKVTVRLGVATYFGRNPDLHLLLEKAYEAKNSITSGIAFVKAK